MKKITTPLWKLEQALRILDREIEDLQARRRRLVENITIRKQQDRELGENGPTL